MQRCTMLLVFLNTMALILSFSDFFTPHQMYVFWIVETLSAAFFAVEYFLRLWSASASQRFRGRLFYGLRLHSLIDLAAFLPFVVVLFTPSRDVIMSLLRLGWGLRHLKLLRYVRPRSVVDASRDALLHDMEEQLAQIQQQVARGRELDLARAQHCLDAVSRQCSEAALRHHELWRQQPQQSPLPAPRLDVEASPFLALLNQLADDLTDAAHSAENVALIVAAYQQSASIFDPVPKRALVDVVLDGAGRVGPKPVPLRRLGRKHFTPMAWRYTEVCGKRRPLYVAEVRRELARLRAAMASALDDSGSQEGEVGLNRAINQLHDVDPPVRLAWDNVLWHLEEEQQKRLQSVRIDIERYGSLIFALGNLWRWLSSRLSATRRVPETVARLWAAILRLYRESRAAIIRALRPGLQRLGLLKTPTRELLRALDDARLDSVFERGLPSEYLRHFDFFPLTDEGLFLGFDEEFAHINAAIERWQTRRESSFILYGHPGVGKSTLLSMARQRLLVAHPVVHAAIPCKLTTAAALGEYLLALLKIYDVGHFDALAQALLDGPARVIWLEDCHHLLFRTVDGLEAIRYLLWLIAKTNHHILWGIALDKCCFNFLNQMLPLDELFHLHIGIRERSSEELRRLIMLRHNRSGVRLYYMHNKRHAKALRRQVRVLRAQHRGRVNLQEALELMFFERLAAASGGNITVALFYWLRAIHAQDADRYVVSPREALNLLLIWELSHDHAFILVAILQHGSLTVAELANVLDVDALELRLELEILTNHNLLQLDPKADAFTVNPVVQKTVCAMLRARNLLHEDE